MSPRSLAELLVDESRDGLVALTLDGVVLSWNRGAEVLFGYSAAEAVGRPLEELVVPDDRRPDARRALADAAVRESTVLEAVRRRKDGSPIVIDETLRRVDAPGGEALIAATMNDATRHARFHSLLEGAPDAMVISDGRGTIQIVNAQAERLFGYDRHELVGQTVDLLVPVPLRPDHARARAAYAAAPRLRSMGAGLELLGRRKDGTEFPVEISLSPLDDAEGTLISAAIRDITERKQLEEQMREASRSKSDFLANMSHELRTPLNAIIGFADLMHKGRVGPVSPDHHEYLGDILTSSRHLLQLINDVLDLAKVEAGRLELRPEEVDLGELVGEVCDILRGMASMKRLSLETYIAPELGTVTIDPGRVRQILYNYLSNAIKFTPEGGRVLLRVAAHGRDQFRVDVEDTGVGIAPDESARLFVAFQQLGTGASRRAPGTGLGLALTKRVVEAHGGRVAVRSASGQGSTFTAILPRVTGEASEPVARRGAGSLTNPSILVVDDDPVALRLAEATLGGLPWPLVLRSGAEAALQTATEDPPGLVVLDLRMPGMDGFAFLARFRALPGCRTTPVIVWTGMDVSEADRELLKTSSIVSKGERGASALREELEGYLGTRAGTSSP